VQRTKIYASLLADAMASSSTTARHVDLAASLRVADVDQVGERRDWRAASDDELLHVGGRWDRRKKRYVGAIESRMVFRVHRGQEAAARWLAEWFKRKASGNWNGFSRVWSALLVGGRRSGKSHLGVLALVLYAIQYPGAILWAISPTLETSAELDAALIKLMPRAWYVRKEIATGRSLVFKLANGARIEIRSAFKARAMKAGRVDFTLLNEAQLIEHAAYIHVRGAIADRSGLCLLAANPPDEPAGAWVEDYFQGVRDGEIEGVVFELDPRRNPFVDYAALQALAAETDPRTFQRDVLGLFTPIGDVVMHSFSVDNVRDPWPELVDITAKVARRELGRAADSLLGVDLQRTPACIGVMLKVFADPTAPDDELAFVVDEFEGHDEDELLSVIEATPRWRHGADRVEGDTYRGWSLPGESADAPVHAAAILDSSSWWQDAAHSNGRSSDKRFAARGWRQIYKTQKDSDANPHIVERMKIANARLCAADGARRAFVSPRCTSTVTALRLYPNRHGKPDRTGPYAHWIDAWSYVLFRCWGKVLSASATAVSYQPINKFTRTREFGNGRSISRMKGWF